jgi:hypothetical protein
MLIYFEDGLTGNSIAVNPTYVTAVFTVADGGEHDGKTAINTLTGSIITKESQLDVVGKLNGELSGGCCR